MSLAQPGLAQAQHDLSISHLIDAAPAKVFRTPVADPVVGGRHDPARVRDVAQRMAN